MKIVHWGKYYHPAVGGIESVTRSLALGAAKVGHNVTVVCFEKAGGRLSAQDYLVNVVRKPVMLSFRSQPLSLSYLTAVIRLSWAADIVQVHVPNMLAAAATLCVRRKTRLIVHWHSDVVGKGLLGRLLKPIEKRMLDRADCIVATSHLYAAASSSLRPHRSKVSVVPIGVPDHAMVIDRNSALPTDLEAWLGPAPVIVSVGRLVSYKGFEVLIEAASRIRLAKIVIVGRGPLEGELREKIRTLDLQERVRIAGFLPAGALDALMRRASLYCLPSVERSEAFGVVLPEAMSYRLPIVATEIAGSGVPWVNAHRASGLNVPVCDTRALADACNAILSDRALHQRLAAGSRDRFEQEFDETRSIGRMLAIYRRLNKPAAHSASV